MRSISARGCGPLSPTYIGHRLCGTAVAQWQSRPGPDVSTPFWTQCPPGCSNLLGGPWSEVAMRRLTALAVGDPCDVCTEYCPGLFVHLTIFQRVHFGCSGVQEALCHSVIPAGALTAHAGLPPAHGQALPRTLRGHPDVPDRYAS